MSERLFPPLVYVIESAGTQGHMSVVACCAALQANGIRW